eukprot:g24339.t1
MEMEQWRLQEEKDAQLRREAEKAASEQARQAEEEAKEKEMWQERSRSRSRSPSLSDLVRIVLGRDGRFGLGRGVSKGKQ